MYHADGLLLAVVKKYLSFLHSALSAESDGHKSILPFPCTVVISSTPSMPGLHHQRHNARGEELMSVLMISFEAFLSLKRGK